MAVYTKLEREEVEEIVRMYDIGELVDFKGISKGIMNSNYMIFTTKDKYILRILEGKREIEEEKKELRYLEHLSENGVPCPNVLIKRDGDDHFFIKNKMAALFGFLYGTEVEVPDSEILFKFGKILAKMHSISENEVLIRNERIEIKYLYEAISRDTIKLKEVLGKDYAVIEEKRVKIFDIDFSKLPGGIIHNDIFPDNVFIKDGEISGVIDFNDAMTESFIHDIAIVINFWIFNKFKSYKKELIDSFLKGYNTVRKLTVGEEKDLPLALDKAALTFLFLRLKKFNFDDHSGVEREFKDYRDLLPMVYADKNIF